LIIARSVAGAQNRSEIVEKAPQNEFRIAAKMSEIEALPERFFAKPVPNDQWRENEQGPKSYL
jgi:hypothetical protein